MTRSRVLRIRTPADFSFWPTVLSHGWSMLPPFRTHVRERALSYVFLLDAGRVVPCTIATQGPHLFCTVPEGGMVSEHARADLTRHVRTVFRLDEDFSPFHREARRHPGTRWISRLRAGRLLRAPTMFEDAVKMICTTNCTWALTTVMVRALVERHGRTVGAAAAFPTAEALAGTTEAALRKECSTGYRARAILELSEAVARGTLDIEGWRNSAAPTEELFAAMCSVRGIGPYAAGNLLKLVGRYEHLGLDSWVRGRWYRSHARGRKVSDRTIERFYAPYGKWRGLFFWLEMTREWHTEKFPPAADAESRVAGA